MQIDVTEFVKEDLKKSGITNFHLENFEQNIRNSDDFKNPIRFENAILYVYSIARQNNSQNGVLESFDFKIETNYNFQNIHKFLNDIELTNIKAIRYVKANIIR